MYLAFDFVADPWAELHAFIDGVGVDGVFTDFPHSGAAYLARAALGDGAADLAFDTTPAAFPNDGDLGARS